MAMEAAVGIPEEVWAAIAAAEAEFTTMAVVKVPEPDLSMEVQDHLKRKVLEFEHTFTVIEEDRTHTAAASIAFAVTTLRELVRILKKFNPEASKDELSTNVHRIVHSPVIVGHLAEPLQAALRVHLPRDRSKWLADDIEGHIFAVRTRLKMLQANIIRLACTLRTGGIKLIASRGTRVALLSAGGGALTFGITGGTAGVCGGTAAGALAGAVPAPVTLGFSIPIGAMLGGSLGGCLGVTAGVATGGAVGGVAYRYRVELRNGVLLVKVKAVDAAARVKARTLKVTECAKTQVIGTAECAQATARGWCEAVKDGAAATAEGTWKRASTAKDSIKAIVQDRGVHTAAALAAGGAVAAGTGGGVLGLAAGGVVGGACGVVPALFTFGLSIPIGAALGSGAGLCLGAATGGTAGLLGGGATGYGVYRKRQEISSGAKGAWAKVHVAAQDTEARATFSAQSMKATMGGS